jgi:hypothetical protein
MWMIEAPKKPRKPLICRQFEKTKIHQVVKSLPQKKKAKKTLARSQGKL